MRSTATFFEVFGPASQPRDTAIGREFDPRTRSYALNPYPEFEKARKAAAVFYCRNIDYWVVTRHAEIISVLRDPAVFSPAIARQPVVPLCREAIEEADSAGIRLRRTLVDEPPETHPRNRRIFGDALSRKRLDSLERMTRKATNRCIDRFISRGSAELVSELFLEVPARIILSFLGASSDEATLRSWIGTTRLIEGWWRLDQDDQVEMMRSLGNRWKFARSLVEKALASPGDDYLGEIVRYRSKSPGSIDVEYLHNVVFLFQFAGHETTVQALSNGARALLSHPAQWKTLCDSPDLLPRAVDEILRYDTSVIAWRRLAVKSARIGDQRIPPGARILLLIGSGNHDEAVFEDGESFDIRRENAWKHISFGFGPHFCMGARLTRLEMKVVFEELIRRIPHIRLVADQELDYIPSLTFRVLRTLRTEWDVNRVP